MDRLTGYTGCRYEAYDPIDTKYDFSETNLQKLIDKLAHYEDLEELVDKHFPGVTVGEMLDITLKHIQGKDEEIRIGRILTNEDAEQWEKYKNLEEAGRLVVLPEGCTIEGIAECANRRSLACPPDIGLPSPLHCNHTSCYKCWEAALKGKGGDSDV